MAGKGKMTHDDMRYIAGILVNLFGWWFRLVVKRYYARKVGQAKHKVKKTTHYHH